MRRAPHRLLPVSILLASVLGCASTLCLTQDPRPAYLDRLRAEYFKTNPQSPYLGEVTRSEVVKGMDILSVLASWGRPERRLRDDAGFETWLYSDSDNDSGDTIEYTLSFTAGVLDAWQMRRYTAGANAIRQPQSDAKRVTTPPAENTTGKRVPKE